MAVKDLDADGHADLVTGAGVGGSRVEAYHCGRSYDLDKPDELLTQIMRTA